MVQQNRSILQSFRGVANLPRRRGTLDLDRIKRFTVLAGVEINEIGDAGNAKGFTAQLQGGHAPHAAGLAPARLAGGNVKDAALGCKTVFFPKPFEMNQRSLTQAVDGVLQRRQRNGFACRRCAVRRLIACRHPARLF